MECILSVILILVAQVAPMDLIPARVSASNSKLAKPFTEVLSRSDFNVYTHQGSKFHKRETKKHLN